jgi:WD40 repeat protein
VEVETDPTVALAYAIKSLELADTEEARRFALRTLQSVPTATILPMPEDGLEALRLAFSPDGEFLAIGGYRKAQTLNRDGRSAIKLPDAYPSAGFEVVTLGFDRRGDSLFTNLVGDVRAWSVPEGEEVQRKDRFENGESWLFLRDDRFLTATRVSGDWVVRSWPQGEGDSRLVGATEAGSSRISDAGYIDVDASGTKLAYEFERNVYVRSLEDWEAPPQVLEHPADVRGVAFHPDGDSLASGDAFGEIRIWSLAETSGNPIRLIDARSAGGLLRFSPKGRWLATFGRSDQATAAVRLWDMAAPPEAQPLMLSSPAMFLNDIGFDPSEKWVVTTEASRAGFLAGRRELSSRFRGRKPCRQRAVHVGWKDPPLGFQWRHGSRLAPLGWRTAREPSHSACVPHLSRACCR